MIRTRTYPALLAGRTHRRLDAFLEHQGELYNAALEERAGAWEKAGKSITLYDQYKSLTQIRRDIPELAEYGLHMQRSALVRLDRAYRNFFRRAKAGEKPGFPRYKGRGRFASFEVPDPVVKKRGKHWVLCLKGIGEVKAKAPDARMGEGKIKLARVVRRGRRVRAQFVHELPDAPKVPATDPVGIDMGIANRMTLSTGERIAPARIDRRGIARKQRLLSRAKKGSNSRRKKRGMLAREWDRVRVRERNAAHRVTSRIVKRHPHIAVEDLKIGNMVRHPNLARSIHEQQWSLLARMLAYKAEGAGGSVMRVDPKHTSMDCHVCGRRTNMSLSARTYGCDACGQISDRDVNAARNILQRGCSLAGWGTERNALPGASGDIRGSHVAGSPGHDAETYAEADRSQAGI